MSSLLQEVGGVRDGTGDVLFCSGAGFPESLQSPAGSAGRTQRGSRSGLCVKGRRGGEVRRRAWRPGSSPPGARSLPPPPQPVGGRSSGGPGTWAPPSHPHSHTDTHPRAHAPARLHLVLFAWRTHRRSGVVPCQPAGQRPPPPCPRARPPSAAASLQTAPRGLGQSPGPDPLATAATVGTWTQQEAPAKTP
ncbi:splicing factor 3B subunit 4-like [Physeter macrocephalus]|uniref:Splicing factor 3B subunit 4-like n=1 Tax=Physeter macrocephalus TaxID=9755 RepID=A0A9W2WPE7_PHYMC|nr:splicing factor 3B subunit 4-like [Physeter catodon]